jgi:phosphoenolpyruvate-protein phosphotransferase (PTS system enzyme I)
MLTGLAASSGIARGAAFVCACGDTIPIPRRRIAGASVSEELGRLEQAVMDVEAELLLLRDETGRKLGDEPAAIFEAQALLLRDPELRGAVARRCDEEKINVEAAWSDTVERLGQAFARLEDPLIRERAADLRDVTRRLLGRLLPDTRSRPPSFPPGCIVVTRELLASLAADLDRGSIAGIVAEQGGPTAHAVILARALGIPTLLYVGNATGKIHTGDPLIVDAVAGRLFIRPPPGVERDYERHEADLVTHRALLKEALHLPAETRDGIRIKLSANIGKIADASAAAEVNAAGIGLYRTEFAFLVEDHFPSEQEQYLTYRKTAECIGNREMVIRVLDVGSDKNLPYFPLPSEPNPSLGQRGTRLLLNHPEVFTPQLRAVLRLSATHRVSVLFPMIGGVDEILAVKAQLQWVQAQLRAEHIPFDPGLRIGAMIETPSAVLTSRNIAQEVDFLSIGSNDLTQYLLASDRGSRAMANYYEPLHPAVMLSLKKVIDAAAAEGKDVSVCGEMAGNPAYTELLLGLGVRSLSVVPAELLEVKRIIRTVSTLRAQHVAECVLSARTISEVKECLSARAHQGATAVAAPRGANVKTPAEAAWENEGGHVLPVAADAIRSPRVSNSLSPT